MSETRKTGRLRRALTVAVAVGAGSVLSAALITDAKATDGYFQDGYGARQKALGGAGVADTKDATAIANNPAGLADVDNQLAGAITLFSPQREYEAGFPGCTPPAFGVALRSRRASTAPIAIYSPSRISPIRIASTAIRFSPSACMAMAG